MDLLSLSLNARAINSEEELLLNKNMAQDILIIALATSVVCLVFPVCFVSAPCWGVHRLVLHTAIQMHAVRKGERKTTLAHPLS